MANGVWIGSAELLDAGGEARLRECVAKELFDIYVGVGYPSPGQGTIVFPELAGFVPASMGGINITQAQVQAIVAKVRAVDSRLRVWAWLGTFSTDTTPVAGYDNPDALGHYHAKMDIDTAARRAAVINACMTVARWGFDGIQDDTEDLRPASLEANGQFGAVYVTFINQYAAAAKAEGFRFAPFMPSVWYNFSAIFLSQITEPTEIIMSGHYPGDTGLWNTLTNLFFQNVQRPVIYNAGWPEVAPLMMSRLEALPYSSVADKIGGYAWYLFNSWTGNWGLWDDWRARYPTSPSTPPPPQPPSTLPSYLAFEAVAASGALNFGLIEASDTPLAAPTITTGSSLPGEVSGNAYFVQLAASGTGPFTWSIASGASSLAAIGLSLSVAGVVGGTIATGTATFIARVTDANGLTADKTFTVTGSAAGSAPTITTTSLPSGTVGTAYAGTVAATGSGAITRRALTPLPPGVVIAPSTGVLSGTPTQPGGYLVTFEADNGIGTPARVTLLILIQPAGAAASAPTPWTGVRRAGTF